MPSLGKTVGYTVKSARLTARGGRRAGRWVTRRVLFFRARGGAGEAGMMRLLDLHAISCAGDTLITLGLAGTVFFRADPGAARSGVALYLLITMAPFALIAPVVGPVLDRFRHGRRWALAVTMLGRAFLAWLISDYIHQFGLYPAAFGVLLLSRAYGVARSAAVPRLLPASLRLSEAGARASVFGTLAGAAVAPIGLLAFKFGPQWPLRVAALVFLAGTVVALRLPPRADSDPPETVPAIFRPGTKALSGRVVFATLAGAAILRWLFGFLALFLAFAVKSKGLSTVVLGTKLGEGGALAVLAVALGLGSFLATGVGTRLHIHRPALLQAGSMFLVALLGGLTLLRFDLASLALLCLGAAMAAGLSKLAVDATIQERIPEQVRASAFAHSETVLMLAWVLGGAAGLLPFSARVGISLAVIVVALAALRGIVAAVALRKEKLQGVASGEVPPVPPEPERTTKRLPSRARRTRRTRAAADHRTETEPTRPIPTEKPAEKPTERLRTTDATEPMTTRVIPREDDEPESPGFHLYRPSGTPPTDEDDE
ncbi:MAG: MFS transporter [Actinobacteria bacterium 13_2_20CM_2_71_6]|nr:MAG: MFS transporter [Actinobacteria bacterium 13_2_20CM_2_71_6]